MDNPYASPKGDVPQGGRGDLLPLPPRKSAWAVSHVRWVAMLMVIQGVLEMCLASGCIVLSVAMFFMLNSPRLRVDRPEELQIMWVWAFVYAGVGAVSLAIAGLHLVAGYKNYYFTGHTLGMIALGGGIVQVMTLCCAPTGVALAIYGLTVYLSEEVSHAFRLVESGHSIETVQAHYS